MGASLGTSERAKARRAMGVAAVLTVSQAAALLPATDAEADRWLREHGLVRRWLEREVVIWGEVLDAIRGGEAPETGSSRRRVRGGLPWADPQG